MIVKVSEKSFGVICDHNIEKPAAGLDPERYAVEWERNVLKAENELLKVMIRAMERELDKRPNPSEPGATFVGAEK